MSKLFIVICSRTAFRWYQDGASLLRRTIDNNKIAKSQPQWNVWLSVCGEPGVQRWDINVSISDKFARLFLERIVCHTHLNVCDC